MYNQRSVFWASCLGMLLFGVSLISLGSILPQVMTRFSLNEVGAGSLAVLIPAGILLSSLLFGPIADRYGYKMLLVVSSLMVVAGLEGIAFAGSFLMLQASIFFIGLGGGVINGATNAVVADISSEAKGANLSLLGVFFGIGALGMPALLAALSASFAYESVIAGIGAALLIPALVFIVVRFPVPKMAQGFPLKHAAALVKEKSLLLFGFVLFFQSGVENLANNYTTTYMTQVFGTSAAEALVSLTWFVGGMTVARLLLGILLKKVPSRTVLFLSVAVAALGTALLSYGGGYSAAGLALMGIGLAATFPVIMGFVGERFAQMSGTAFSIALVIALTGNMIINYGMGIAAHEFGIKVLPVGILICLLCIVALLRRVFAAPAAQR